jgi:hypothetical protein
MKVKLSLKALFSLTFFVFFLMSLFSLNVFHMFLGQVQIALALGCSVLLTAIFSIFIQKFHIEINDDFMKIRWIITEVVYWANVQEVKWQTEDGVTKKVSFKENKSLNTAIEFDMWGNNQERSDLIQLIMKKVQQSPSSDPI